MIVLKVGTQIHAHKYIHTHTHTHIYITLSMGELKPRAGVYFECVSTTGICIYVMIHVSQECGYL